MVLIFGLIFAKKSEKTKDKESVYLVDFDNSSLFLAVSHSNICVKMLLQKR